MSAQALVPATRLDDASFGFRQQFFSISGRSKHIETEVKTLNTW